MKQEKTTVEMQKATEDSTYTIIMYYQEGTYIKQVLAKNVKLALFIWAKELDTSVIEDFNENYKKELQKLTIEEIPSLIDGMKNIWYADFLLFGNYIYVHIIKTDNTLEE